MSWELHDFPFDCHKCVITQSFVPYEKKHLSHKTQCSITVEKRLNEETDYCVGFLDKVWASNNHHYIPTLHQSLIAILPTSRWSIQLIVWHWWCYIQCNRNWLSLIFSRTPTQQSVSSWKEVLLQFYRRKSSIRRTVADFVRFRKICQTPNAPTMLTRHSLNWFLLTEYFGGI